MTGRTGQPPRSLLALPLAAWAALLALMAASTGVAFLPIGRDKLFVSVGISVVQAGLVGAILMRLDRASMLVRLAAAAAFLWIAFLFTLSGADYFSRPG